ncbi:MAG: flagellar transcriptional regulator FlhC [Betaproteobacteria bacterium]|nr:flagellar transcriptional regulator FlhC [Betaproteobacteria bacterium]
MNARAKSIVGDAREVERAAELIRLGARLQLLESEINLSRERLLRLYKEIQRKSPPKGMLPFSTDWFTAWQPNIHASLFANIYEYLDKSSDLEQIDVVIRAYRLYLEQVGTSGLEPILSITRAWRLVKFVDAGMMCLAPCTRCSGRFVLHSGDLRNRFVCGLCHMPARAGKTAARKARSELIEA